MGRDAADVVAVIRGAGERTVNACRRLLLQQLPASAVEMVDERPFESALRRTYEIGIERGAKWTMTLDADVLLRQGSVAAFFAEAEKLPEHYIQLEGRIHDKLTGLYRQAGHRIYRTKHLELALKQVPAPRAEIRPEYTTLQRMERLGFPSKRIGLVMGIHDYEQFYRDVYRKAVVHAQKHPIWLHNNVGRWRQLAAADTDFRVALRGLHDGLVGVDAARIDTRQYVEPACAALDALGLHEKDSLSGDAIDFDVVENMLQLAGEPPPFEKSHPLSTREKLHRQYAQLGPVRIVPVLAGAGLCVIGEALKRAGRGNTH